MIVLFAVVVYANALGSTFVPDDRSVVLRNEWVQEGGSLWKLLPPAYYEVSGERTYRPTATLLYYLEYRVWGKWRLGYHLASVLIHVGCAALLYLLVVRLFHRRTLALLTGLLFAVHPVTTEAVNGIAYREDALALLPMLGAWLCHLGADEGDKRRPWLWPVAWALYVVSILAKGITVGLPVLILAHDYFFRDRGALPMLRRRWPAYLGFVVLMAVYVPFRLGPGRTAFEAAIPLPTGSVGAQVMATPSILAHYLRLMLWPVGLSAEYSIGLVAGPEDARFWGPILALAAALCLAVWAGRRAPEILIAVLWAAVTLAPAANVFPMINPMAERYLYVPAAGFCLALAVPIAALIGKTGSTPARPRARKEKPSRKPALQAAGGRGAARAGGVLTCAILVAFGLLTAARNADWADMRRLSVGAVRLWPGAARAHFNLGAAYYHGGCNELSRAQYKRITRTWPGDPRGYLGLARLKSREGRPDAALRLLTRAMRRNPHHADTWREFSVAYRLKGDWAKAYTARGHALLLERKYEQAVANLLRAYPKGMRPAGNLISLASSYEALGDRSRAIATWRELLRTGSADAKAMARENLDRLLAAASCARPR